MIEAFHHTLRVSKREYEELKAENAALKKQIAANELSWETERKEMVEQMESSLNDVSGLIDCVEAAKAREKELERELHEMSARTQKQEEELSCLSAGLQSDKVQNEWKEKYEALQQSCEHSLELAPKNEASAEEIENLQKQVIILVEKNIELQKKILKKGKKGAMRRFYTHLIHFFK